MKRTNKGMAFIMALFIVFTFCFSTPVNAAEENIKKVAVSNSLTGSKKTVNVAKGKTVKLNTVVTADAKADKTVKYKSANSKIASVTKAGVIKGIKVGKTKITVSSSKDPKKKATIKVTVKASAVKKVSIISPKSNTMTEGDTLQLKAKVTGKKTAYKKTGWSSSDKTIATVSKTGKVQALLPGKVTITATSLDGSNKQGKIELDIKEKDPSNAEMINLESLNVIDKKTFSFELSGKASITSDDISVLVKDNANDEYKNTLEVDKISTKDKIIYIVALSDKSSFTEKGHVKVDISSLSGQKSLEKEYKINSVATATPAPAITSAEGKVTTPSTTPAGKKTTTPSTTPAGEKTTTPTTTTKPAEVKATAISLSNSIISVIRGRSDKLSVSFNPADTTDKTCTWKSADPSIASVDSNGNVSGHKKGFTEITVTHKATGLKTSCTIHVNALASVSTQKEIEKALKEDIDELVVKTGEKALVIPSGSYTDMVLTVCGNGQLTNNGRFKEVSVSSGVNYIENSINIVNGVKNGTLTNMEGALNPKDEEFGAKGDGKTDDTNAFRKLLWAAYLQNSGTSDVYGVQCKAIFIPSGKYRITAPIFGENLKITNKDGTTTTTGFKGAKFEISGSGRESTIIYFDGSNGDVLFDNQDLMGFTTFRDIGFESDSQKCFMNFYKVSNKFAQRLQFISCGFQNWGRIIRCNKCNSMLSEVTFAYCKILGGGTAKNDCELFTLYDPQAVNWRFIETDIETFRGDAFCFRRGSCVSIIGGSIIPAYENGGSGNVFNFILDDEDSAQTAAPGNSPQAFCDGTRFEIKGTSSLVRSTAFRSHTAKVSFKTCCFAITPDISSPNYIYLNGALDAYFDECYGCSGIKIAGNVNDINYKDENGYPGLIEPTLHFVNCGRMNIDTIVKNSKFTASIRDRNNPRIIIDDQYDFYLKDGTYAHTKDGLNLCRQTVTLSDGGSKVNVSNGMKKTIQQYGYVNYIELNVTGNSDYTKYPMTVTVNGVKQTIDFTSNQIYKFEINDYVDNVKVTFNHGSNSDLKVDMNMAIIKF